MADYQVTEIIPDKSDPDRRIDAIYGPVCGLLYLDDAIRRMAGGDTFWTWVGLHRAAVFYVPATIFARHHLKTSADGFGPNNLLRLPHYA